MKEEMKVKKERQITIQETQAQGMRRPEEEPVFDEKQMERIRKDNRKEGKKYIVVLLLSGLAGLFLGIASVHLKDFLSEAIKMFNEFMERNAFYAGITVSALLAAFIAVVAVATGAIIVKGRRAAATLLSEETADGQERLERKLGYCLWMTSGLYILEYLYFALVIFSTVTWLKGREASMLISVGIAVLFIGIFAAFLLHQKLIDLLRIMNPEKRGSVYDLKFRKKWEESCDEAEKLMIYRAGYRAFCAVNTLCIILWTIFIVLGLTTGTGFLGIVTVIIIWATLQCVYCYCSIQANGNR